jgi:hydroxymethylpyrimidine pyrophosphatase-like HAD family hydrolase
MDKMLVFDMDGTIADLYNVENWLEMLRANNPTPYIVARPIYDTFSLNNILELLKAQGWKIAVVTWVSQNCDDDFKQAIRLAKTDWLNRYNFPYDELHIVKYGTTKANCVRKFIGRKVLVDDNEKVRQGWNGETINANENILEQLVNLLVED